MLDYYVVKQNSRKNLEDKNKSDICSIASKLYKEWALSLHIYYMPGFANS